MPLPSLTPPANFPQWRADGHGQSESPLYANAPMSTGHTRTRRLWSASERTLKASAVLNDAQLQAFNAWHEGPLQAGLQPFAARVANLGPGLVWFDALLLEYETEPLPGGYTILSATLLLRGAPSAVGPA